LLGFSIYLEDVRMLDIDGCRYRKREVNFLVLSGEETKFIRQRCKCLKRSG
jgi:hypothetical protein